MWKPKLMVLKNSSSYNLVKRKRLEWACAFRINILYIDQRILFKTEYISKTWLKGHLWLKVAQILIWIPAFVYSHWSCISGIFEPTPWFHWTFPGNIHSYYAHKFSSIYQFIDSSIFICLLRESVHMLLSRTSCFSLFYVKVCLLFVNVI